MRKQSVIGRIGSEIAVGIRFGAYLLYGAICGLLLWGLQRWTQHRDWRVLARCCASCAVPSSAS